MSVGGLCARDSREGRVRLDRHRWETKCNVGVARHFPGDLSGFGVL